MATSLVPPYGRKAFPAGATGLVQFQFCALNTAGQIITPAGAGVFAVVLDDAGALTTGGLPGPLTVGNFYGCVFMGVQKVISGASLNPGVAVKTDTSGHAVAASSSGDVILGWTLSACSSGDLVQILLDRAIHQ